MRSPARGDSQTMAQTIPIPADLDDLVLAPVALEVSSYLERLGLLTTRELILTIAAATDLDPVPDRRCDLLLELLDRDLNLHGWSPSWCPSGLRLQHDHHQFVLGVPPACATS